VSILRDGDVEDLVRLVIQQIAAQKIGGVVSIAGSEETLKVGEIFRDSIFVLLDQLLPLLC
jgi:hypothetical protein